MPIFEYTALRENGKTANGVIDADTPRDARGKLRDKRMHVTALVEVAAGNAGAARAAVAAASASGGSAPPAESFAGIRRWVRRWDFGGPSMGDLSLITRQFATLLNAGIPLSDALSALIEQIENRNLQTAFRDIREKVSSGSTLHDAMANHPQYFSKLFTNMVSAGEASGTLGDILVRVADYQEKQNRVRGKVSAALAYPAIMVVFGCGVVVFLLTSVLPKITTMLVQRGNVMPLPTRVLMGLGDFMVDWWFLIVAGIFGLTTIFRILLATEAGGLAFDTWKLRMPIFGVLIRKQLISRFSVTFATLLKSGIPAMECLTILKTVVENKLMEKTIEEIRKRIVEGQDIAQPMRKSGIFPPMVGYMVAVGEQSGQLEEMLGKISQTYDEEIDLATQKITALIEPLIIVVLAVAVVGIIMAVILPMVNLTNV